MKKIGFILIVIVLLLIINNLIHSIYDLWQKQGLLTQAQNQLSAEQLRNTKLKTEILHAQSPQFIDEEARNKLFLVKPGEQEVLISQDLLSKSPQKQAQNLPNWQKWLKLFF
jgi:cell division protein FtsB